MGDFVAMIAVICIFGLPVGAFMFFRALAHRERMEMIRQGMVPQGRRGASYSVPPPPNPATMNVRKGKGCDNDEVEAPYDTLRKGIRLTMIGLALTIGLSFIGYHDDYVRPGPWLLGGLIPMFVGLAQVILALLSGASLSPARQQQWQAPPQFGPGPGPAPGASQSGAPPSYDTSYTYRPGDLHELQPPGSPPDRR